MYPDEALKICNEKLERLKRGQPLATTPLEKELFSKDIAFYELVTTALEYFDKC